MEKFVPDIYQQNIFTIDYNKLKDRGIICLLFDLDNTLVPTYVKKPTDEIRNLFNKLKKEGFKIILFSNCRAQRMSYFNDNLVEESYYGAKKPFSKKFLKVIKKHNLNISEVAIIGDQLFTDILGGNRIGITTILVDKISKDNFVTKVMRLFERSVFRKLRKKSLFTRGRYYD